jgi:hypothetical protein
MRRIFWAGLAAAIATVISVAPVQAAGDGATVVRNTGPVSGCPLSFPDVGLAVCGNASDVEYQLVFTPSGNENSWFKVENFTGTVTVLSTGQRMQFTHESATLLVHRGPQRPDFILINHPSPAPLPHQIAVP